MIRSRSLKHLFLIPVVIGFLYTAQEVQGGEYKHMNLSSIHSQLDYYNNEGMYFLKTTSGYTLWSATSLVKIPREDIPKYNKLPQINTIKLNSAKQEYEGVQLVMTPVADMNNISLEFTDLTGPQTISKDNITWNLVEYINVKSVTRPGNRSGLWPDPLPEQSDVDLKGGTNNPLWITTHTPDVLPGLYKGTVNILQDGQVMDIVDIELNVWDFELPAKTSIYTSASLHSPYYRSYAETEISKYEQGDAKQVLKRYYKNLIEHRVKDYTHGPILPDIKIDISDRQNVVIDFTGFDEIADTFSIWVCRGYLSQLQTL